MSNSRWSLLKFWTINIPMSSEKPNTGNKTLNFEGTEASNSGKRQMITLSFQMQIYLFKLFYIFEREWDLI